MEIKSKRIDKGIKQVELARALNVTKSAMCLYESGKRNIPSDKLPLLAKALGCTIDELFNE